MPPRRHAAIDAAITTAVAPLYHVYAAFTLVIRRRHCYAAAISCLCHTPAPYAIRHAAAFIIAPLLRRPLAPPPPPATMLICRHADYAAASAADDIIDIWAPLGHMPPFYAAYAAIIRFIDARVFSLYDPLYYYAYAERRR